MAEPAQTAYQYYVSITLTNEDREYKWDPTVVEKTLPGFGDAIKKQDNIRHMLHLTQTADEGDLNVIEVTTTDTIKVTTTDTIEVKPMTTPLAFLKAGSMYQTTLDVQLPELDVVLKLKKGSGPAYVIGLHTVTVSAPEDGDEEEGDEADEAIGDDEADTVAALDVMETEPVVVQPKLSLTTPIEATNGDAKNVEETNVEATNDEATTGEVSNGDADPANTNNEKKRKIDEDEEGNIPQENGDDTSKVNGTATEDAADAKKVKLVTDDKIEEEKPINIQGKAAGMIEARPGPSGAPLSLVEQRRMMLRRQLEFLSNSHTITEMVDVLLELNKESDSGGETRPSSESSMEGTMARDLIVGSPSTPPNSRASSDSGLAYVIGLHRLTVTAPEDGDEEEGDETKPKLYPSSQRKMAEPAKTAYPYKVSIALTNEDREYKWDPAVVEKMLPGFGEAIKKQANIRHMLHLTQAILGDTAEEGDLNVIEVTTTDTIEVKAMTTPLALLMAGSICQTTLDVQLSVPDVVLKLKKGSGPAYVFGLHTVTVTAPEDGDEEGDEANEPIGNGEDTGHE